jgi:hypothetical protein
VQDAILNRAYSIYNLVFLCLHANDVFSLLVQMIFSVTEMVLIMAVVLACIDDRFIFVLV